MKIRNAKAVVSGGASGLGFATASRVVKAGGHAVLLDVNEDQGQTAAKELGERATFIDVDVSDETAVRNAMQAARDSMGGISLAVNCAGIATAGRTLGRDGPWPAENFSRVIRINLVGSYIVTKEAAAHMQHNEPDENGDRGVIVSTASIAAFEGQIGQAAYSASKGGVVSMMLPLAREFAQFGIRVNTIAPGIFLTPMMAGMPDEVQESLAKQVPYPQRLGKPDEYASTVQFIYENAYLNGETIRVDGAIRMQPK
jgi:NAD(P)-dependent dehydrogenase (short-subunit alcohol dehydrogenase family)